MMHEEIKFIESFGKLTLKEGDILVIKSPQKLSQLMKEHIYNYFNEFKRRNNKNIDLMILDDGLDIGVINRDDS